MAFTDAQKNQIATFLGWPARVVGTRYVAHYPIYSQMDLIGSDPVLQAPVEAILTELVALDTVLASDGAANANTGAVRQVDEVQFFSPKESQGAMSLGALKRARMLVRRLAQRMGGEHFIASDYFGTGLAVGGNAIAMG